MQSLFCDIDTLVRTALLKNNTFPSEVEKNKNTNKGDKASQDLVPDWLWDYPSLCLVCPDTLAF